MARVYSNLCLESGLRNVPCLNPLRYPGSPRVSQRTNAEGPKQLHLQAAGRPPLPLGPYQLPYEFWVTGHSPQNRLIRREYRVEYPTTHPKSIESQGCCLFLTLLVRPRYSPTDSLASSRRPCMLRRRAVHQCEMLRAGSLGRRAGMSLLDVLSAVFCFVFCCRVVVNNVHLRIFGLAGAKLHSQKRLPDSCNKQASASSQRAAPSTHKCLQSSVGTPGRVRLSDSGASSQSTCWVRAARRNLTRSYGPYGLSQSESCSCAVAGKCCRPAHPVLTIGNQRNIHLVRWRTCHGCSQRLALLGLVLTDHQWPHYEANVCRHDPSHPCRHEPATTAVARNHLQNIGVLNLPGGSAERTVSSI